MFNITVKSGKHINSSQGIDNHREGRVMGEERSVRLVPRVIGVMGELKRVDAWRVGERKEDIPSTWR